MTSETETPRSELRTKFFSPAFLYAAVGLLCALAAFFRIWDLGGRNLWFDEAWLALAVQEASPAEALRAGMSTPPFYTLALWVLVQVAGGSEVVLRSLSLVFGLGTVLLFIPLARRLAPLPGWLLGTALLAASPIMVFYSKELKQYSADAFFALLILLLAERVLAREGEKGWLGLALAGLIGMGFSHALIFTLPVAVAVLWWKLPQSRMGAVCLGALWAAGFAAYYFLFFRRQVDPYLTDYWAAAFPDFSSLSAFGAWLGKSLKRYFHYFLWEWSLYIGPPLLAAGIWTLARQGAPRALFYLGGPLLLSLAAAALHRYPFMAPYAGNRLMLFSAPMLYLVIAAGLGGVMAWLWRRRQKVAALALAGLVFLAFKPLEVIKEDLHPSCNREEIKPLVVYLEEQARPEDWVYIYYFAIPPFRYYAQRIRARLCLGTSCLERELELPRDGRPPLRLWLIASHYPSLDEFQQFLQGLLGPWWQQKICLSREGAVLYCFEWQPPRVASKPGDPVSTAEE